MHVVAHKAVQISFTVKNDSLFQTVCLAGSYHVSIQCGSTLPKVLYESDEAREAGN